MHQQVRTTTTKSGSNSDGPGAVSDPGSLVDILETLEDLNLQMAGGRDLDEGDEFVFAVHHEEGDDGPVDEAVKRLKKKGYKPEVHDVHHCLLDDSAGTLLECVREAERMNGPVHEIFIGTPIGDKIPVQVVSHDTAARGGGGRS